jgi:hypothetical protein
MTNVVPKVAPPKDKTARVSRISTGVDGSPVGVALFFTVDELSELGVDPGSADAVSMWVHDGNVYVNSFNDYGDSTTHPL